MHRPAAQSVTWLAAVIVAGVLAGCSGQQPSAVTHREARDRFLVILDEVQSIVGGEWNIMDDPTARECVIPWWVAGERYPALRVGTAPDSVRLAADRVEQQWSAQGMRVTRTDVADVVEVKGESADGELVLLRVSDSASTLLGESECRPL